MHCTQEVRAFRPPQTAGSDGELPPCCWWPLSCDQCLCVLVCQISRLCAEEAAAQEQTGQVEECLKVNLLKLKQEGCKKVKRVPSSGQCCLLSSFPHLLESSSCVSSCYLLDSSSPQLFLSYSCSSPQLLPSISSTLTPFLPFCRLDSSDISLTPPLTCLHLISSPRLFCSSTPLYFS